MREKNRDPNVFLHLIKDLQNDVASTLERFGAYGISILKPSG